MIVTPDHGEMLGNHGMWGKGHCFYEDVLRVPLITRLPDLPAGRRDELVSLVDLMPTILGLAGAEPRAGENNMSQARAQHLCAMQCFMWIFEHESLRG